MKDKAEILEAGQLVEEIVVETISDIAHFSNWEPLDHEDPIDRILLDTRARLREIQGSQVIDALHDPKSTLDALDLAIQLLRVIDMDKAARVEEVWDFIHAETGPHASPQLDMWAGSAS